MSYTPEDQIRKEQVCRLSTDEDPRGSQHGEDVYTVDLKPKKAKTRDREKEEALPSTAAARRPQATTR